MARRAGKQNVMAPVLVEITNCFDNGFCVRNKLIKGQWWRTDWLIQSAPNGNQ